MSNLGEKLLDAYADAAFEVGEWDKNESDESLDAVCKRSSDARDALMKYITALEDVRWALGELLEVPDLNLDDLEAGTRRRIGAARKALAVLGTPLANH